MKIKKGDMVEVITGRSQSNGGDRGKQGKVIAVVPRAPARARRGRQPGQAAHQGRPTGRGAKTGGIMTQEAPIHVSNVMLVDPETKKRTRVGLPQRDRRA